MQGIFKLPIVRNILDKLITSEEQDQLMKNIGQFQVGNQKKRNIRDHTLIIHAIVNEAKERKLCIDILFTDIKQYFDSIWLDEATNDLFDSGVTSRNLNILYEGNSKTQMCVETNFGQSERAELTKVVMQGSVTGGSYCSNQISKICNKLYEDGDVYMYQDRIPIPPLAMVDDIVAAAVCNSTTALNCNIKTDAFIQRKKMESQVGEGKCQWVHIGNDECCSSYYANNTEISSAESYKWLGDHVADGWDIMYTKRWEKAQGYNATCLSMSTEMSLGYQVYQIAKLLHQSIFINGTLVNMETWPNCTPARMETFERIEQAFFRKILDACSKTPMETIYLELGIIPLRFHLIKRRILYFHTVMQRDDDEITKKVVTLQMTQCFKGDFFEQVESNLKTLMLSDIDIVNMSETKIKDTLWERVKCIAFDFLINKAKSHSKVNDNVYLDCNGCSYFDDRRFSPDIANILFKFRTRTFLVKNNFRNNYKNTNIECPICSQESDTQEHLFQCKGIMNKLDDEGNDAKYEDIFASDVDTLLKVAKKLKKIVGIRKNILNPDDVKSVF